MNNNKPLNFNKVSSKKFIDMISNHMDISLQEVFEVVSGNKPEFKLEIVRIEEPTETVRINLPEQLCLRIQAAINEQCDRNNTKRITINKWLNNFLNTIPSETHLMKLSVDHIRPIGRNITVPQKAGKVRSFAPQIPESVITLLEKVAINRAIPGIKRTAYIRALVEEAFTLKTPTQERHI